MGRTCHVPIVERLLTYLAAIAVLVIIGGTLGAAHFDRICDESDPEVTECDVGAVYALVGGVVAFVACVVVAVLVEGALWVRRRRRVGATDRQ